MCVYTAGDWVIYRKSKRSVTPGANARELHAASKGEKYSFVVEKYWIVAEILPNDRLLLRTRRGRLHELDAADENLRRANWIERLLHRHQFRSALLAPTGLSKAAGIL